MNNLENLCANELKDYKICHKHFHKEDYSGSLHHRFLLKTAIPVLYTNNDSGHVDTVDTINDVQQPSLLSLTKNENEQQQDILQSTSTKISYIYKQIQQHSEQLSEQRKLLKTYNVEHVELQKQMLEMRQKNQLQQSHCENKNDEGKENIIQGYEKRLTKLEKQIRILTTPRKNRTLQRRAVLQNITRAAHLSPTARILYNINVTLRRAHTRLKRLLQEKNVKAKHCRYRKK